MSARCASSAPLTTSAADGPVRRHAHVERPVALEREAARGIVELHGGDADVEHDAIGGREAGGRRQPVEIAEAAFDQLQPTRDAARPERWPAARAAGSRSMPSTRAPGAAVRIAWV